MDDLLSRFVGPFIRHGVVWVFNFLIAWGIFTGEEASTLTTEIVVALTAGAVALIWSLWQKYAAAKLAKAALAAPAGTPMAVVKASVGTTV